MNILNIDDMTQTQIDSAINQDDQGMGDINTPPSMHKPITMTPEAVFTFQNVLVRL